MSRRCGISRVALPHVGVIGAALLVFGGGCQRQYSVHGTGEDRIVASYSGTTLSADLPSSASIPAVLSAAEQVFRKRGYTIVETRSTEDKGMIAATPPGKSIFPRMLVRAVPTARGTTVALSYEPAGDMRLSQSVLDGIMERLEISTAGAN